MSEVSDGSAPTLAGLDEPGDAELISAVRGGDLDAYGLLFARHVDAARRLARQLVSAGDVDDLVSEGFAKVLGVLQRGGGPDLAFRAYLLTSIRRLHIDRMRSGARLQTTDDLTPYDPGVEFEDTAVSGFENAAAAKAFQSLPERWQQVLWHTEVEGQKPADIAPLLGMSANSVSALAYRAREGLRQAFVTMHAQDAATDECAAIRGQFGAYIRGGVSKRDAAKIEAHLKDCRECTAIYLELAEVNSNLGAVLAPIVLGSAGAGYLAAHAGAVVAAKGGALLFLDRGKDWVLHNPVGRATGGVAGAAAAAVVVAASLGALGGHSPSAPVAKASTPPSTSAPAPLPTATPTPTPTPTSTPTPAPTKARTKAAAKAPVAAATPAAAPTQAAAPKPAADKPVIATPIAPVQVPPGAGSVTINLAAGARDPQGRRLGLLHASIAPPGHGTLVVGGGVGRFAAFAVAAPSTVVTYTPDPGWRGTDRIDYTLTNHHGGTVSGVVKVTTPNQPPVARDDSVQSHILYGGAGTTVAVLSNDSDANGDALTITGVSNASHGTAAVQGDHVVFVPESGYAGPASFSYTISDGHGGTATATATITYGLQPDAAPVAQDVVASTDSQTTVRIPIVPEHASDPDGDPLTLGVDPTSEHHGASITVDGGALVYDPRGFVGQDTFTYTVSDGLETTTATVTVHVAARAVLDLSWGQHGSGSSYVAATLSGLPAGATATVVVTVQGFDHWTSAFTSPGCDPVQSGDIMTVTCTVSADGDVLAEDFVPSRSGWTVNGSLTVAP